MSTITTAAIERPDTTAQPSRTKVAYVMSRFPKLTETFVVREMIGVERAGHTVDIYPLRREKAKKVHPEAAPLVRRAQFTPWFSWAMLAAHGHYLRRKPLVYIATLWTLIRANFTSPRFLAAALALFPKAAYLARRMAADGVTHLHAHFCSHPAAVAFVIGRLEGISYSFTAHGSDLHCDRHMLAEKVRESAFVVAISDYNRRVILEECGGQFGDKVRVVHCGVDATTFSPRGPTPFDLGQGPFTVLCVGTLHEVKGQRHLLAAAAELRRRRIEFRCHFIGDGPDEPELMALASRLRLRDQVVFHGSCSSEEVVEALSRADVLAAPSVPTADGRREGIPVVLMEAMSREVPVVASDLSGIPELVENEACGLLVPPGDDASLADALQRLAADGRFRDRLGTAGREKVRYEFDIWNNAHRLAQMFNEC